MTIVSDIPEAFRLSTPIVARRTAAGGRSLCIVSDISEVIADIDAVMVGIGAMEVRTGTNPSCSP